MYILSGKGTTAGVDLSSYIYSQCQEQDVLFDDDFPEYTLDFKTQLPSVSKSSREGKTKELINLIQNTLQDNEKSHTYYMLLCFTAHQLIKQLKTSLININLVELALNRIDSIAAPIAYFGTFESLPSHNDKKLVLHPNHVDIFSDLILSIKRGYENLKNRSYVNSRIIIKILFDYYNSKGIKNYLIACTDLHVCKKYLMELGVSEQNIISIIEIAGDKIIEIRRRNFSAEYLDKIACTYTLMNNKYRDIGSLSSACFKKEIL